MPVTPLGDVPAPPEPDINSAQQVPGCSYPTTEQVLSSLSVVLNGGGLSQFGDVVHEMEVGVTHGVHSAVRSARDVSGCDPR